jgi:ectoine hydroxylase
MWLTDDQVARFQADGFLVLPRLFSDAEVARLRAQLPALYAERRPENWREKANDEVRTAFALNRRNALFGRLARHPRLIEPAVQLTGSKVYLQQVKINAKAAFTGDLWQWHQDFATHHAEDGVPQPTALNLHVFLDEVNEFNGPLMFGFDTPAPPGDAGRCTGGFDGTAWTWRSRSPSSPTSSSSRSPRFSIPSGCP